MFLKEDWGEMANSYSSCSDAETWIMGSLQQLYVTSSLMEDVATKARTCAIPQAGKAVTYSLDKVLK